MAKIISFPVTRFECASERAPLEAMLPGLAVGALIWVAVIWLFV